MKFLTGKDYPHLCSFCRKAVTEMHAVFALGVTEDTDDPEAPCNEVYDRRMFCGGYECVNKAGDAQRDSNGNESE